MRYIKLPSENFGKFFNSLREWGGRVYGPVKKGKVYSFQEVGGDPAEMALDYNRTMLPPKKFFVGGPRETILRLKNGHWEEETNVEPTVLFGLHSCDIHGLKILDGVYLNEPVDPPYYLRRREATLIVGISCMPDEYCFCKSLGTHFAMDGFDLFLHELPDGWLVRIGSVRGHEIAWRHGELFEEVTDEDLANFREFEERRANSFRRELPQGGAWPTCSIWPTTARSGRSTRRYVSAAATATWSAQRADATRYATAGRTRTARCARGGTTRASWRTMVWSPGATTSGQRAWTASGTATTARVTSTPPRRATTASAAGDATSSARRRLSTSGGFLRRSGGVAPMNPYMSHDARILEVKDLTPREKLFTLRFVDPPEVGANFSFRPGQFVIVDVRGFGEFPISLCSSPTRKGYLQLCIRKAGRMTKFIHGMKEGDIIGIRGPYGNGFPMERMEGSNLILVAGGLGMAPPPLGALVRHRHGKVRARPPFLRDQGLRGHTLP